jgi:glutamate racemase
VVLACTHYPFLVNIFRKLAPWPVDWLDPAEAIARRALDLVSEAPIRPEQSPAKEKTEDFAVFTSGVPSPALRKLMAGFGLKTDTTSYLSVKSA